MRADDLRHELRSLADDAPEPTPDVAVAIRRGRARRARGRLLQASAAATIVLVIAAGVVWLTPGTPHELVRTTNPPSSSPSLLGSRPLPRTGLVVLEDAKSGGYRQPSSFSIALLDDHGALLARLPRATIADDMVNDRWNAALVATDKGVAIEAGEPQNPAGVPAGCITSVTRPRRVALCNRGARIMLEMNGHWSALVDTPPAPANVRVSGHWTWAARSPNGRWVLAQWSGECESPAGFLISVADGSVRAVTGQVGAAWIDAPASFVIGWTSNGDALFETVPSCDSETPTARIYRGAPTSASPRLLRTLPASAILLRWITLADERTTVPSTLPAGTYDLLGGKRTIAIDHLGDYVWTSPIVVPHLPDKYSASHEVNGVADVRQERDRLVEVTGGWRLRITFTVVSFSPGANVTFDHATGEGFVSGT